MTPLQQLFEPLFSYLCVVSRSTREGAPLDYYVVRSEIIQRLSDAKQKAQNDPKLSAHYQKLERPIHFCVDHLITTSAMPFRDMWNDDRLGYQLDPPSAAGDTEFFELLDIDLKDRSDLASERAAIWHTCLGLGMVGPYAESPNVLIRYMTELAARMRPTLPSKSSRICEEAYEFTDARALPQKTGRWLAYLSIALVGMFLMVLIGSAFAYRASVKELNQATEQIGKKIEENRSVEESPQPIEDKADKE